MFDLFGMKARQDCLSHLARITKLEDEVASLKAINEVQAQRIDALKHNNTVYDLDFPNSKSCNTCAHSHCDNRITGVYYCHYWNHCFDGLDKCPNYKKEGGK